MDSAYQGLQKYEILKECSDSFSTMDFNEKSAHQYLHTCED